MNVSNLLAIGNGKEIYIVVDNVSQVDEIMHRYDIPGVWGTLHKTIGPGFVWPITLRLRRPMDYYIECTWEPGTLIEPNVFYVFYADEILGDELLIAIRQIRSEIYGIPYDDYDEYLDTAEY